ncbi:MAG: patatin-like phospholipase family protein [Calditrichia bacterium]
MSMLHWYAGAEARERIEQNGLHPNLIRWIIGAAGGPKWLLLSKLDQVLFGEWLQGVSHPIHLTGGSIASWRLAAACMKDPAAATRRLQHHYIHQYYDQKPSPADVTRVVDHILHQLLGESGKSELLSHPFLRHNIITVRSRHLLGTDLKPLLMPMLGVAATANAIHPRTMSAFFERILFHHPSSNFPTELANPMPTKHVVLTNENILKALTASGSIPLVMSGIRDIPDAPAGTYHDGGIADYHIEANFNTGDGIVLYPHFMSRIIPGWFDKFLSWRKPRKRNLRNILMLAPSPEFVSKLPNGKITDRNDFYIYEQDERIRIWEAVATAGQQLADEFMEAVSSETVVEKLRPLEELGK